MERNGEQYLRSRFLVNSQVLEGNLAMKKIFRLGAAAIILSMICSVSAAAINVTFVNEPIEEPDLFITKTVESAVEDYEAPADDIFTFNIKVNGSAYKNEYYFLSTDGGPYEEYDETGTAYQTDRYGRFFLQAGQTAKFPYIGQTATYEVSEEKMEEYITQPASGTISGVMQGMAAAIEFTNIYVPTVDAPGQETAFKVYKTVLFPDGLYAPEGPDFTFELTLDGEPFIGEQYTVFDTATEMLVDTKFTDSDGQFILKGNQYAVFQNVLSSMDYKVEEILPAGSTWHTVGSTVQQGATTYPLTRIDFTNVEASLAVEKVMKDNAPADGQLFTFTLTSGTSRAMSGVPYYLYSRSGYPVDEEIRYTNEFGQFDLEANQIAVLLGIDENQVTVKEESISGYELVTPGTDGYQNIGISDYPGTYRFVNAVSQRPGTLTVIKTVRNATEVAAPEADTFRFVLEKATTEGYTPVTGTVYTIEDGEAQFSYETGKDGSFAIKAGQRAVFEFLEVGEGYRVTERLNGLNRAYTCLNDGMSEEVSLLKDGEVIIFANLYSPDLTLNISKVDFIDHAVTLGDVVFALYSDKDLTNLYATGTTDENGQLTFNHLSNGTWYLVETSTIGEYILPTRPFELTIDHTHPNEDVTATITGAVVTSVDGHAVNVRIENSTNILWTAILPLTGGEGTHIMTATGITLLLCAGYAMLRKKKGMSEI